MNINSFKDHPPKPAVGLWEKLSELHHPSGPFAPRPIWLTTITQIAITLGLETTAITPFVEAWRAFYNATLLLDHLQDGDPLGDQWLIDQPPAIQYHLAFSSYVVAQQALARLTDDRIPIRRILRLHAFWASSVAQIAHGQYLDLTQSADDLGSTLDQ
jgi:hypothetical protein